MSEIENIIATTGIILTFVFLFVLMYFLDRSEREIYEAEHKPIERECAQDERYYNEQNEQDLLITILNTNNKRAKQGKIGICPNFFSKELRELFWKLWKNKKSVLFEWFPDCRVKPYKNRGYINWYFFSHVITIIEPDVNDFIVELDKQFENWNKNQKIGGKTNEKIQNNIKI